MFVGPKGCSTPSDLLSPERGPQAAQIPPDAAPNRRTCVEQAQAQGERRRPRSRAGRKNATPRRAARPERPPGCMEPPRSAGSRAEAQRRRSVKVWCSCAGTRRMACHPLPVIVSRVPWERCSAHSRGQTAVARSPRARGPAASDQASRERSLGCCERRCWLLGPRSTRAPPTSAQQPRSAPALLPIDELSRRSSRG